MSRVRELGVASMARLAGASEHTSALIAQGDEPNREQRRDFIKHAMPRPLRRAFGFGQWRRHRYLTRK